MQRMTAIDSARGVAMLLMLINHAAWRVPEVRLGANYGWNIPEPVALSDSLGWLNLAQGTPIFMLLTGFGVALFEHARARRGWSRWQITRFLLLRGAVLVVLDMLIIPWIPSTPGLRWESKFLVLTSIAGCVWLLALLRTLSTARLLLLAAFLTIGCQIIYPLAAIPGDSNLLRSLMLYPSPADPIAVGFPVFAWFPVIALAYCSGRYVIQHPDRLAQHAMRAGLIGLLLWSISVATGAGRLGSDHPLLLFKHPPSLAYLSFNTGMAYLLLAALHRLPTSRLLSTLGQCALAFYVIHWHVLLIITLLLSVALNGVWLWLAVIVAGLGVLYPVVRRYRRLRTQYPGILQYL